MIDINELRSTDNKILVIGSHRQIIQSILDFDYLSGKEKPSVIVIVAGGKKYERYFYGKKEIALPVFSSLSVISEEIKNSCNLFLNVSSGRRVLSYSQEALQIPSIKGGVVFAEDVPEEHAISLYRFAQKHGKFVLGPASVGLLIPKSLKLGAIGGVDFRQLVDSHVFTQGNTAVFSASGGMTSEIIRIVALQNKTVSFALAFGGDRFPMIQPKDAFLMAQNDDQTKNIVYFGELGGTDEYALVELIQSGQVTKPVVAYIAGVISDYFEEPPQFGHAKAMAKNKGESALEKRQSLKNAGAQVAESFDEFVSMIASLEGSVDTIEDLPIHNLQNRQHALITSRISGDVDDVATILGQDVLEMANTSSFASIVASMFLGKKNKSTEFEECVDFILRLLVDHGPYVSGAVNTIITARAGRDLPSALATGLLTIGPRFGGAINQAAENWILGVSKNVRAVDFVEDFAKRREYIAGIGHKKYRVDMPDPRVNAILEFAKNLENPRFTSFAKSVEKLTVSKKGNLILNVDGAIACTLLDILSEKEGYSDSELKELVTTEFFNALFILSRSVGFISHFLDQKRMDEGLLRLPNSLVTDASSFE
jgi:succinyl-CoA synthetase alpha subunit